MTVSWKHTLNTEKVKVVMQRHYHDDIKINPAVLAVKSEFKTCSFKSTCTETSRLKTRVYLLFGKKTAMFA